MGVVDFRRPPLPAPTESMDEHSGVETEVATNLTTRTDKTSYSIPEDGRPITISTQKVTGGGRGHTRNKSQTSLLIEYFEASKTSDKSRSRPSVRVKVTPSATKKSRSGNDAIQITGIGSDRKPSYTRRISLGNSNKTVEAGLGPLEATEVSQSSGSNVSGRPPLEIEVLNNASDISNTRSSRGLMYAPVESNVSSMPPDSLLETENFRYGDENRELDDDEQTPTKDTDYLKAPIRTGSRSRSASRERLTQKVMEKLGASSTIKKSSRSSRERSSKEHDHQRDRRSRHSSKSHPGDGEAVSGAESSLVSSNLAPSNKSYHSGSSQASRMTNNPKLLEMVEDTIKRMILPEINAIKEDQKADRKLRKYSDQDERDSEGRRVSKSSSSPNIASKPKVVLNRDGNDPGTVLSRGDSERVKQRKSSRETPERPSSRRSSGRHSRQESYDDSEEKLRHRSSKGSNTLRGAAAAGLAGAALTAAALKNHDSESDMKPRRKRRSKSRSSRRTASLGEPIEDEHSRGLIPPMPLASRINDSEITRESILSHGTDRPQSRSSAETRTPIREVSRGSVRESISPASSRTPTRTPTGHKLGMSLSNQSIESAPKSVNAGLSNKARLAALTAAGLGGAAAAKGLDADGYGDPGSPSRNIASPVQSVSSLRKNFEDDALVPAGLRPQSAASRSSAGRLRSSRNSQTSLRSMDSPPTTKLADSRKQSQDAGVYDVDSQDKGTPGTPSGETAEEWFQRQHMLNDRYRDSIGETANRDSYQTNPYPQDEKRFTFTTDDSFDHLMDEDDAGGERHVRDVGLSPNLVHTPIPVESAVASLMEPSIMSSNVVSSTGSSSKRASYSQRMEEHLRDLDKDSPPMYNGSTLSQSVPSQARWAAIRGHAKSMSDSVSMSPRQSPAKSIQRDASFEDKPIMGASSLPMAEDPMPEIGHYDDSKADVETNPSIVQGPLGGDVTGKSTWPYTPEPQMETGNRDSRSTNSDNDGPIAAAAGGAAAIAAAKAKRHASMEDEMNARQLDDEVDREATPTGSPAFFRDEGYATDARTRSAAGRTPQSDKGQYGKKDLEDYEAAMNVKSIDHDDAFGADPRHDRHFSGNSHGMQSPLYDSSTGKGIQNIESKDIVALMDHLTVRDSQRNARDTETITSLVRNAAEMRQSFDEMKRFILEQDKFIMQNTDRNAEQTTQRILGGPRPQPTSSPRTPRRQMNSEEEIQTKRKGVLRRALKGLTGGKSGKDLAKIEDMLMQILDNVEDLKMQNGSTGPMNPSYTNNSLDSYEKLRNAPDSGYEPEGRAGTSSPPSQSEHFAVPAKEKQQFHSGYDGRRGSEHRVSTVLEDDEDDLEPHEAHVLNNQFENNEQMLTPTQETYRTHKASPWNAPNQGGAYVSPDTHHRKHKSNGSSLFGMPKISRWSRTTASSAAPDPAAFDSPKQARDVRPPSEASRSQTTLDEYDDNEDDQYHVHEDDRLQSKQSPAKEQGHKAAHAETRSMRSQGSRLTRTPSPLIPSEASSYRYDDERMASPEQFDEEADLDDPKYHAHRNSILLQHPQPRPGNTPRHQNNLESQAQEFDDTTGTNSDLSQRTVSDFDPAVWGSSATAGLARHRLSHVEPLSPVSLNSPAGYGKRNDHGPLVPQSKPATTPKIRYEPEPEPEEDEEDWEPQFSNSGFSKGGYYSSPYGSGHLLEPIEEVRYSLETDRDRRSIKSISPEPQVVSARAVDMRSPGRKITGPRPMGSSRTPSAHSQQQHQQQHQPRLVEHTGGTVRRKPVPRSEGSVSSVESETF